MAEETWRNKRLTSFTRTSPLFFGVFSFFALLAGFSFPLMAVASRAMCPMSSSERCAFTRASWTFLPRSSPANSAKAREKVDSEGMSLFLTKPQIMREIRHGVEHVDEHPGRGKIVDRLGDKGACDGLSVFRSSPHPVIEGRGDVLLYFDDFQTHDEVFLYLARERVTEAFFQMGEQIVLHPRFQP